MWHSLACLCEFEVGQVYVVSSETTTGSKRTPALLERERNIKAKLRQIFRPFQKGWTEEGRLGMPTLNVGGTVPWLRSHSPGHTVRDLAQG